MGTMRSRWFRPPDGPPSRPFHPGRAGSLQSLVRRYSMLDSGHPTCWVACRDATTHDSPATYNPASVSPQDEWCHKRPPITTHMQMCLTLGQLLLELNLARSSSGTSRTPLTNSQLQGLTKCSKHLASASQSATHGTSLTRTSMPRPSNVLLSRGSLQGRPGDSRSTNTVVCNCPGRLQLPTKSTGHMATATTSPLTTTTGILLSCLTHQPVCQLSTHSRLAVRGTVGLNASFNWLAPSSSRPSTSNETWVRGSLHWKRGGAF